MNKDVKRAPVERTVRIEKVNGMNTILEQWNLFEELVVPKHANQVQRKEMRRAFYAGAEGMMRIEWQIGDESISESAGVAILEGCRDELQMFGMHVLNGYA